MYTIQALQAAKRYHINAKMVILSNGGYQLLKNNIDNYWKEDGEKGDAYPDCFSLYPKIDYVELAHSMGVKGKMVSNLDEVESAVEEMLDSEEAYLIELIVK